MREGKHVLITGGSRGIGRACVKHFCREGYRVVFTYARRKDMADLLVNESTSEFPPIPVKWYLQGNPQGTDSLTKKLEAISEKWKAIIFNAATGVIKADEDIKEKHLSFTLESNLYPMWRLWRWFIDHAEPPASFILVTSWGSHRLLPGYMAVGTVKAAQEALVRYFAREGIHRGIRVNGVIPGTTATDALQYFPENETLMETVRRSLLQRLIEPDEVASVIHFLTTDRASAITGTLIPVDGGYHIMG